MRTKIKKLRRSTHIKYIAIIMLILGAIIIPAGMTAAATGKTTICHATGNRTNPYVKLTVSGNALNEHLQQHNGDFITTTNGNCNAPTPTP